MELNEYDTIIVAFSGGKDSTACFLHLLDSGVDPRRIELWHHLIDGAPGSEPFMDWPITEKYCEDFAEAFNLPLYFSWREGGFKREMLRNQQSTGKVYWQNPDGTVSSSGGRGPPNTRRKFPQVSADLRVRWCSAYLKIDVMSAAINNQERFKGQKTLVVTGERAEESKSRARYRTFEDHRCNNAGRTVHHWRPIHAWSEEQVWEIIERHRVWVHPAYWMGWGRLSCMTCIFGSENQWASASALFPEMVERIAEYEDEFGLTIRRDRSVREMVEAGEVFKPTQEYISEGATGAQMSIHMETALRAHRFWGESLRWELPPGAYGENAGPN